MFGTLKCLVSRSWQYIWIGDSEFAHIPCHKNSPKQNKNNYTSWIKKDCETWSNLGLNWSCFCFWLNPIFWIGWYIYTFIGHTLTLYLSAPNFLNLYYELIISWYITLVCEAIFYRTWWPYGLNPYDFITLWLFVWTW